MSLEAIKKQFEKEQIEEVDIQELRLQMQYLEKEVSHLLEQINTEEETTQYNIKQKSQLKALLLCNPYFYLSHRR